VARYALAWPIVGLVGLGVGLMGPTAAHSQGMAPPRGAAAAPPFDLKDPDAVRHGGQLYQQTCTGYCHGKEGRISRAPALRGREFDPGYLFARISNGGNPPMPAFSTMLPPEDIWRLVAYIMSLSSARD
jgi:mono/diheme cytochrome c family protein